MGAMLKQLSSWCSKNEKKIKLTVNTDQVMFSGEIYYYWPLNSLEKSLVKIVFLCIIYCVTNSVAVMYSRNILMAEKRIVKICRFFFLNISNNYYIYLKSYFEIFVTNEFFSIIGRSAALIKVRFDKKIMKINSVYSLVRIMASTAEQSM